MDNYVETCGCCGLSSDECACTEAELAEHSAMLVENLGTFYGDFEDEIPGDICQVCWMDAGLCICHDIDAANWSY